MVKNINIDPRVSANSKQIDTRKTTPSKVTIKLLKTEDRKF